MAGIIDGEGSIYFTAGRAKKWPRPVVTVKMVDRGIPNWLCATTGLGSLLTTKGYNSRCRSQRRWVIVNREAECFLKRIIKFIRLKQKQAQAVLSFYKGGDRLKLVLDVKRLNRRGT